jgi:type I restriction enzyme S subunit
VGWVEREFDYFGNVITGKTPSTLNRNNFDGEIQFVKTPDMSNYPYVVETTQCLSLEGAKTQIKKYIPKNSLMISCIGSAGEFALASEECQTNQQINSIVFYKEYYTFYFYCFAKGLKPLLEAIGSNGATMTNVNKGKFEKILIKHPEESYLIRFHDIAQPCFDQILCLLKQNQKLKQSRDILLPRLMSGTINVES